MKKTKNTLFAFVIAAITLFIIVLGLVCFNTNNAFAANADAVQYYSDEQYTDSDYLLLPSGEESFSETILTFSDEVKSASNGTSFPDLTQVIPAKYLESTETNAIFSYNGKEYGFYIEKENNIFNLLLVDFYYVFEGGVTKNNEYIIGINPVLQQSFRRTGTVGNYEWQKCDSEYLFYVTNPQIAVSLFNENSLNSFDENYSKKDDDGLIIQQTRVNFGNVQFSYDFEHELEDIGQLLVNGFFDVLGMCADELGDLMTIFEYIEKLNNTIDNNIILKEELVVHNNEQFISTKLSKSDQLINNFNSFSRIAGFIYNKDSNTAAETYSNFMHLSDNYDSYLEYIVQLNDTNYRSRLVQFGCYYLVKVYPNASSGNIIEWVENTETNGIEQFYFGKSQILFDDKCITELSNEYISQQELAYLLSNGNQKFTYNCIDTTTYQIKSEHKLSDIRIYNGNQQVQTTKINDNLVEFSLAGGNTYNIVFSQNDSVYYDFIFCKKSQDINFLGNQNIRALNTGESAWYKYTSDSDKYLSIIFDNNKYGVDVYCSDNCEQIELNGLINQKEFHAEKGQTYYIKLTNITSSNLSESVCDINKVESLGLNETKTNIAVYGQRTFLFNAPVEGKYLITVNNGLTITVNAPFDGTSYSLSVGEYYVKLTGNTANGQCSVKFDSEDIEVNGGNTTNFVGNTKSIFLKFTPNQTLNYNLALPSSAQLEQIITDEKVDNVSSSESLNFTAGKTYYLRVVATNGNNLPSAVSVGISPVLNTAISVGSDGITKNISGSGVNIIEVKVNEDNLYEFNGLDNSQLYNSFMQEVDKSSLLRVGTYYLKTTLNVGETYILQIKMTGTPMQIGDTVAVNTSRVFKYDVIPGTEYEIRIGASADHTFTTGITLLDSNGESCEIIKLDEYYTFTATDSIIYVKLTMTNVGGQAGIFFLNEVNFSSNTEIQTIEPEEINILTRSDSKFIKIPAGNYKMFVKKNIGTSVWLYEVGNTATNEHSGKLVDSTTLEQSTVLEYSIVSSAEMFYLVEFDSNEVDFLLSYADTNAYKIEVLDKSSNNNDLCKGINYQFVVYRYNNGVKSIVPNIGFNDIKVYKNDILINGNNGGYSFNEECAISVIVSFWGIEAHSSFNIKEPRINAGFDVSTSGFYFTANGLINFDNTDCEFSGLKLTLYGNGSMLFSQTYSYEYTSIEISDYSWYETLTMKVDYTYDFGEDKGVSETISYKLPYFMINSDIGLSNNEIALIDASQLSSSYYIINKTITIPNSIKQIYFLGTANKKIVDLDIVCNGSITINMKNFNYTFKENGLKFNGYYTVDLNVFGECSIAPKSLEAISNHGISGHNLNINGSGKLSVMAGKNAEVSFNTIQGYAGIMVGKLTVKVNELYVKGGTAGDMAAVTGVTYYDELSGAHGKPGAEGGYAIYATSVEVYSSCKVFSLEGGNGGRGGDGADGLDGTGVGVAGGNGGQGGDGGPSGFYYHLVSGGRISTSSSTQAIYNDGKYGDGGNGGNGGNGGIGARGGDGGKGGSGFIGGNGGNGGNGGTGEKGRDAVWFGQSGSNGGDGGNGGNGGQGGNSRDENGTVGTGGVGGTGGDGGEKGKGIFVSYQDGQRGQDGINGSNGEYRL